MSILFGKRFSFAAVTAIASVLSASIMPADAAGIKPCTSCFDAGSFFVYYGDAGLTEWQDQVGTFASKDFINPGPLTQNSLNIADGIQATLSDPTAPSVLSSGTLHRVTPRGPQYWAGIKGDDVNTWAFSSRTTGFAAEYFEPAFDRGNDPGDGINRDDGNALQLTINGSTLSFGDSRLTPGANGFAKVGVVAKASFDTVQWSVENGSTNPHAYEGWDVKNLKVDVPEPLTTALATGIALGFGFLFHRQSKRKEVEVA
jgi:hypothetical protein